MEDIPSKTIFRASPDLVSRRRGQLEKFLQGVVKSEPLATCECTVQVRLHLISLLHVSILLSSLQFLTPNRERRLLTVYPGAASCNPDCPSESLALDAQSGACARHSAAAGDSAGDRYAVDWSGVCLCIPYSFSVRLTIAGRFFQSCRTILHHALRCTFLCCFRC